MIMLLQFRFIFQFAASTQVSSWAIILLTSERFISVWMPFKFKKLCSRRRIVIAWTVISLPEDDRSGIPSSCSRSRSSPCQKTATVEYHLYVRGRGHLLAVVWRQHALLLHCRPPINCLRRCHLRGLLPPRPVCPVLHRIGLIWAGHGFDPSMDWIGLGWIGFGWTGMGWVGLGWVWLDWVGLGWIGWSGF